VDAAATIESYVARSECGECGYDGELVVEMGGGLVSVTCPACDFSASAPAEDVGAEWAEFMAKIEELPPEDRGDAIAGGVLGYLVSFALSVAALVFGGVVDR
jgi:hypothetical protein